MSLKEDANQFDNFFFVGEKPSHPNQGGDDPWLDGMPEEVPETKVPTVGKKDLGLVLGRLAQPFVVVQRQKTEKNTADYGQTSGMFPDD